MLAYTIGSFSVSDLVISKKSPRIVLIEVKKATHNTWKPVLVFSVKVLFVLVLLFFIISANVKNKLSELQHFY